MASAKSSNKNNLQLRNSMSITISRSLFIAEKQSIAASHASLPKAAIYNSFRARFNNGSSMFWFDSEDDSDTLSFLTGSVNQRPTTLNNKEVNDIFIHFISSFEGTVYDVVTNSVDFLEEIEAATNLLD